MTISKLLVWLELLCLASPANIYNLTLPWGVWQSEFNPESEVYSFRNVRFGAAPTGQLRFQQARYPPDRTSMIQSPSGFSCRQAKQIVPGTSALLLPIDSVEDEDCLFLDVYVPKRVMEKARSSAKASVIVWLYGGAFAYGSKDFMMNDKFNSPFYNGTSIVRDAAADTIFVAGNYRLGAFGWLAGATMEEYGCPNAGLSDQRLLFDWVSRYIAQVGGNTSQVTAWGQSAGGSSIMHHLISHEDGKPRAPAFQQAMIQSPAFQWIWTTRGSKSYADEIYITFTCIACTLAKNTSESCCPNDTLPLKPIYTVAQLASLDAEILRLANRHLFTSTYERTGLFPVGPTVDGKTIKRLAPLEFADGHIAPLRSLLVSHTLDEASLFAEPLNITTAAAYTRILRHFIPGEALAPVRAAVAHQYPVAAYNGSHAARFRATLADSLFLSNTRMLLDAYTAAGTPVYALRWDGLDFSALGYADYSRHATDLVPLFYDRGWDLFGFVKELAPDVNVSKELFDFFLTYAFVPDAVGPYRRFFTTHAATGKPQGAETWNAATPAQEGIENTMVVSLTDFTYDWEMGLDEQVSEGTGAFWLEMAREVERVADGLETSVDVGEEQNTLPWDL